MASLSDVGGTNLAFVEELYAQYLADPQSVDSDWRSLFASAAEEDGDLAAARRAVDGPAFRPSSIFNPPQAASPDTRSASKSSASRSSATARPPVTVSPQPAVASGSVNLPDFTAEELAERVEVLQGIRMFDGLPADELSLIARLGVEERYGDGDVLFREGDEGNALYLLIRGQLLVLRQERVIAELGPGEVTGELAVLDSQPRMADVKAHGDVVVMRVGSSRLLSLMDARPRLARGILSILSSRLRRRDSRQDRVHQLVHAFRVRGHLEAEIDPLGQPRPKVEELELAHWGLAEEDLDSLFSTSSLGGGRDVASLRDMLDRLRATYCGAIGVQFMHIDDLEAKRWLSQRLEDEAKHRKLTRDEQLRVLTKLTDAELFEQFIHKKFLGAKRFSLEGAETLIPLLDLALEEASDQGVDEVVVGMAHRGRLNVLVNLFGKSAREVFREYADEDPDKFIGRGDVKYHLGFSCDRTAANGRPMHMSLCFNPSHLEFVNPVLSGRVRAKQERFGDHEHRHCMAIAVHGDAAFAGQGVTQELLNMAELEGYRTGGTLHVIVNNQIGFTTSPESGRSTHYATDVARMLQTPIFHVNGEDPDAVAQVVRTAMDYRREFRTDVVIDMYCYRRYGHNEGDEPSYTQPLMYDIVRKRKSVRESYLDRLLTLDGVERSEAEKIHQQRQQQLEEELSQSKKPGYELRGSSSGEGLWQNYLGGADQDVPEADTAVAADQLSKLLTTLTEVPEGFAENKKLHRLFKSRQNMATGERPLDWGAAEALAFATLLLEGTRVRLAGQDSGRGTFSHRHAVWHDVKTGDTHVALQHLADDQGDFQVWDSPLSEIAVLGFEYGYSLDTPDGLTLWEAQFGDFCNVAQVIIDQFITSGEDKWQRLSGLTMLLPHGFEGQGPEHSSARLERFLNMCAEDNIQVVNLTTPAQLFHCLRRQMIRPLRKPLVIMSPKSLLRLPAATSSLADLAEGRYHRILGDPQQDDPSAVKKVLLTSGKIYYELDAERTEQENHQVAILRLEQYYPLDQKLLEEHLSPYADGTPVVWVQEEPRNMGAWSFLQWMFGEELFGRWPLSCVSRPESASPATGSAAAHKKEQRALIEQALAAVGTKNS